MVSKASVNFIRIAPRKVRYVIDLIRAKSVSEAQAILNGSPRRAGDIVRKLLNQALDAAEKNSQINANDLVVSKVLADGGPSMRRFRAASMGRASVIKKRTSHIYLELDVNKHYKAAPSKTAHRATPSPTVKPATPKEAKKKPSKMKAVAKKMVGAK